ncbi:class I SAM-dependent methyltransferase [Nocardioides sp. 616]|uniref:class I SAM-dependent methyltransferase n=1 Tax=Nocardioides sp. 616 TaxID=2268090 RepID=UPI000CE555DE|nr:class I SAM-dependent methyltransferase [Nocardioides sp. 616]
MTDEQPPDPTRSPDHSPVVGAGVGARAGTRVLARSHERGRPEFPRAAADWLVAGQARTVLELGAGTGKLTRVLLATGHDVHACDADEAMLEVLRDTLPGVRASTWSGGDLPAADRSVDVVVCVDAFESLDHEQALPEIARVLKPGGHLAVAHHERDERIPWVRRLGRLLGTTARRAADEPGSTHEVLVHSTLFSFVEEGSFKSWQDVNRETVVDLARSHLGGCDEDELDQALAEVVAFYDEFGRGMDGMQLPYLVRGHRTQVVHQPGLFADGGALGELPEPEDAAVAGSFLSDGTDTDMLLIDFR